MFKSNTLLVSLAVVAAGCMSGTDAAQIPVAEQNDLGVTGLNVDRLAADGFDVFELRGVRDDGEQVASIRLRTGDASLLDRHLADADGKGTEILARVGDGGQQIFMPRQSEYEVMFNDPTVQQFVKLPEVVATLAKQAHLKVVTRSTTSAPPSGGEQAYDTWGCDSGDLNTSPPAWQCCMDYWPDDAYAGTMMYFVAGAAGKTANKYDLIIRRQGGVCRDLYSNPCSGNGCYYGPNGYHVFQSLPPYGGNYWTNILTYNDYWDGDYQWYYSICANSTQSTPSSSDGDFSSVSGTFPVGQGCCGGAATNALYCCDGTPTSSSTCSQSCYDDDYGWYDCSYSATATGSPGGDSGYGDYDY